MSMKEDIQKLKQEKNAIVLAHYYVEGDVQDVADFVGDSFALAKRQRKPMHKSSFCRCSFYGRECQDLKSRQKGIDAGYECRLSYGAYGTG